MKDIKFRAWDLIEAKMCLVTKIDWIEENVVLSYGEPFTEEHEEYERFIHDIKLMQYTGLKDKNGKEIYEGDIIEYEDYTHGAVIFGTQPTNRAVMKWNKEGRYILRGQGFIITPKECEVIGNKYKNPDLMRKGE